MPTQGTVWVEEKKIKAEFVLYVSYLKRLPSGLGNLSEVEHVIVCFNSIVPHTYTVVEHIQTKLCAFQTTVSREFYTQVCIPSIKSP
jgi:hypothetical protein